MGEQEKLINKQELIKLVEEACSEAGKKMLEERLREKYDCAEHEIRYAKANY